MCPLKKIYCIQLKILHSKRVQLAVAELVFSLMGASAITAWSAAFSGGSGLEDSSKRVCRAPSQAEHPLGIHCTHMQAVRPGRSCWRRGTLSRQGEGNTLPTLTCWALSLSAGTVEAQTLAVAGGQAAHGSPDVANDAVLDVGGTGRQCPPVLTHLGG